MQPALSIPKTLSVISLPGCGVPDIKHNSTARRHRHLYSYFAGTPSWPSDKRAFACWSAVTTLNFTQISPADSADNADITIGFYHGDHGDWEPFDEVLGTLAHAFLPTDGRFHLDAAKDWVAEAVMYPSLRTRTRTRKVELMRADVDRIQRLYGGNPDYAKEKERSSIPETSSPLPATAAAAVSGIVTAAVAAAMTFAGYVL